MAESLCIRLNSGKQKTTQRDSEFVYVLRRLPHRALPLIYVDAREEWVLDQFLSDLDNLDMRNHVQLSHPVTLEEAIRMATEYESFETPKTSPRKPVNAVTKSASSDSDIKQLQEVITALAGKVNAFFITKQGPGKNSEKTSQMKDVKCFKCGKMGHLARNCTESVPKTESEVRPASPPLN